MYTTHPGITSTINGRARMKSDVIMERKCLMIQNVKEVSPPVGAEPCINKIVHEFREAAKTK